MTEEKQELKQPEVQDNQPQINVNVQQQQPIISVINNLNQPQPNEQKEDKKFKYWKQTIGGGTIGTGGFFWWLVSDKNKDSKLKKWILSILTNSNFYKASLASACVIYLVSKIRWSNNDEDKKIFYPPTNQGKIDIVLGLFLYECIKTDNINNIKIYGGLCLVIFLSYICKYGMQYIEHKINKFKDDIVKSIQLDQNNNNN